MILCIKNRYKHPLDPISGRYCAGSAGAEIRGASSCRHNLAPGITNKFILHLQPPGVPELDLRIACVIVATFAVSIVQKDYWAS